MVGLNEPGSIPSFVMLEVVFHPKPLILLVEVYCFHPNGTFLARQCVMTGFKFLKARQLLLHKLEHTKWTVLVSYMMFDTPKELPLTFRASLAWIWKPPSLIGCTMSC